MKILKWTLSAVATWASFLALAPDADAYTGVTSPYGNDAVIVLVGRFASGQAPKAVYKNVQGGSMFYGGCATAALPNTGSPNFDLADNVTVYGGTGNDFMEVATEVARSHAAPLQ